MQAANPYRNVLIQYYIFPYFAKPNLEVNVGNYFILFNVFINIYRIIVVNKGFVIFFFKKEGISTSSYDSPDPIAINLGDGV